MSEGGREGGRAGGREGVTSRGRGGGKLCVIVGDCVMLFWCFYVCCMECSIKKNDVGILITLVVVHLYKFVLHMYSAPSSLSW